MKPIYILMTDDGRYVLPRNLMPGSPAHWDEADLTYSMWVDAGVAFPRAGLRFESHGAAEAYLKLTEKLRAALIRHFKQEAKERPVLAKRRQEYIDHHAGLNMKVVKVSFEDC